jgi:hypothetical protein
MHDLLAAEAMHYCGLFQEQHAPCSIQELWLDVTDE